MIETGLVSVSFRSWTPEEVVKHTKEAGLAGIEWGGDVHVPAGDVETAKRVRALTEEAGLQVFAYGSYYRPGEHPVEDFKPVLESAVALGAPSIRVWAGAKWSWRADEAYVQKVVEDTQAICDMAAEYGIQICYEYHGWTLTDNRVSAAQVHGEIGKENMKLYWQPNFTLTEEDNLLAVRILLPKMRDVHVFCWDCTNQRQTLATGAAFWEKAIGYIKADAGTHRLMLEFVKDNSLEQLFEDAKTLNDLVAKAR